MLFYNNISKWEVLYVWTCPADVTLQLIAVMAIYDMVYRTVGWNTWHMNSSTELIHELDHAMHIDFEHTRSFAIVKPIDSIAAIAGWSLRVEVAVSVVMMFMRPSKCLPVVYCILVFVSFHPCHNQ